MRDGVIADLSVAQNLLLVEQRNRAFSRFGFLRTRAIRQHCEELVDSFSSRLRASTLRRATCRAATSRS